LLSKPFNKSYNELVELEGNVPMDRKKEYIDFNKELTVLPYSVDQVLLC
jgi:hypothetical protein